MHDIFYIQIKLRSIISKLKNTIGGSLSEKIFSFQIHHACNDEGKTATLRESARFYLSGCLKEDETMLNKLLILALFIACVMAYTSIKPKSLATEKPQTKTETPVGQFSDKSTATAENTILLDTAIGNSKLTILFDNTTTDSLLKPKWGFAALVEYGGHTLLFDTGADGSILLDNMRQLGVKPESIEAIIFSHEHSDHIGGLQALLDTGIRPTVYAPSAFSEVFKEEVRNRTRLVEVGDSLTILPGVHLSRPVGSIAEQCMALETRDGTVIITGCAHPGIVNMVRKAQEAVPGNVSLLAGGFHLYEITDKNKLKSVIAELRQLGLQKIMPTHCTGSAATDLFRNEFGKNCLGGGVGVTITF